MKRIGTLLSLLLVPFIASGQDTLTTVTYNLLNYQSGVGSRDQYYRTILRHVRPDLLVVQEISNSSGSTQQASVDSFYSRVVNVVFPGQFLKGTFVPDPNDTGNEIYYKPSKFTFVSNTPIHTALRDISEFKLYSLSASDTLRVYSVHLKATGSDAGTTYATYDSLRAAEVDSLRKVTNALPAGKFFIVCGDYNFENSTDLAYQKLLQDNVTDDGNFLDALSLPGQWKNRSIYAQYHTQSPRLTSFGGGAGGGMDDRFDMILYSRAVSQPGRIRYLGGSLTPIGNDGNHFNLSINQLPNTAVPDSVANALYYASDHLPVSAQFVFSGGTGFAPEPTLQASNVQFGAVTSSSMEVTWTNGDGGNRIVVARAGSAVSFVPNDGQTYSANNNFASAPDLGSGNKAVFSGIGNSVAITGLSSNTTYHFAVYEFNGSAGTQNYLATLPATNSQLTLSVTYYSQGNLAPNLVTSWNSDRVGFGSQPSDFTSGVPFVIQSGHTMITTAPWTVSGAGNRIQIESGGVLQADHLISTAAFQIDNGGTYIHNSVGSGANGAATDLPGLNARLFDPLSTVQFKKWGVVTGTQPIALPSGVSWGNLIINVDTLGGSWQQQAALTTIAGNLIIQRTGGGTREFRLNANVPATLSVTIAGDLLVSGGTLNLISGSSILTLTLGGAFLQTGGTFNASGAGPHSFSFAGGNPLATFASSGGTFTPTSINWTVPSGKTLTLNSSFLLASGRTLTINGVLNCGAYSITGAGAITVSPDATLGVGSADGINSGTSLGNIRVSGSRTFDVASNYVLDGTTGQVTGNGFPASVNNLTINNSNGAALTVSVTVNGTLVMENGALSIGANILVLNGNIDQTNGSITGGASSSITFGGSGSSANLPAVSVQNLIVNRTNGISLAGPVTVFGALTVSNGSVSTGDNIITLGPVATISEPADNPIEGTVTTTRTVSQSLNNTFGGLGIELNATGVSPGSTVVTRKTGIASVWNENHSILRYVDLSPETNNNLNATLVFHYEASELNGHIAAALRLWKSTDAGTSWQLAGGTVDTSARIITVTGVSSFSRWTAADSFHFASGQITSSREMFQGWNIISVPLDVTDYRKATVFPTSTSDAFAFHQVLGYVIRDTLKNGLGYWLKFPSPQTVNISGLIRDHDTAFVFTGWNLIGSTSVPVAVTAIQQIPSGIVSSSFFEYLSGYAAADSLRPAHGYWIKVNQDGRLILR